MKFGNNLAIWKEEDIKSLASHLHNKYRIDISSHKNAKLCVDTKKIPCTKLLAHRKFAGNDFPYYLITEGKQILVRKDRWVLCKYMEE